MSELRPGSPVQRPASVRSRQGPDPRSEPASMSELAAIQQHLVRLPTWEGGVVEELPELEALLARSPDGGPDGSYVAMPRWTAATWRDRLAAVQEHMLAERSWPSLLWCDELDLPPDLPRELLGLGWARVHGEAVLWTAQAAPVPHLDPALRIEAVQPRSLASHQELEASIFGLDAVQVDHRRAGLLAALESGRLRAWIVWLAGEAVAVARLAQGDGVAAIQGIGVVATRRRQGLGTLITSVATRAGMAAGNRIIWLSVREDDAAAARLYRRLGFAPAFGWSRYLATEARSIGPDGPSGPASPAEEPA